MSVNIVEDRETQERIELDAMESALDTLEILNETYELGELEFVGEAITKLRLALNTITKDDWENK